MNIERLSRKKLSPFPSETEILGKLQQLKQQLRITQKDKDKETIEKEIQHCLKMLVGWKVANRTSAGDKIGLGAGTTSEAAIKAIGQRIANGDLQNFSGVATSDRLKKLAQSLGINILENFEGELDWGFDGADEVEENTLNLIKGGGAAATAEKRLAKKCKKWIVIVDEKKMKTPAEFGTSPVAIEVNDKVTLEKMKQTFIEQFGAQSVQPHRLKERADTGGRLFEVQFEPGTIKSEWEQQWLKQFPWLIDSGLFMGGYPDQVWVARSSGEIDVIPGPSQRQPFF